MTPFRIILLQHCGFCAEKLSLKKLEQMVDFTTIDAQILENFELSSYALKKISTITGNDIFFSNIPNGKYDKHKGFSRGR